MNEKIKFKILILSVAIEILFIITFLFVKNNIENMVDLILFCSTIFVSIIGIFYGLMLGLISSVLAIFSFGTYILFQIIFFNVSFTKYSPMYLWIAIIPIVGYTMGYFGNFFSSMLKKIEFYNTNLDNYITIDMITTFKNAKTFYVDLKEEMDRARRYNHKLSVILIKIKYLPEFKAIYGINQMNNLLSSISQRILDVLRSSDKKYKIEEDTFALILPNTDLQGAQVIQRKFKNNMSLIALNFEDMKKENFFNLEYQTSCLEYTKEMQTPIEMKKILESELEYDV